ncbi:TPA: hypothetical protein ACPWZ0_003079 [Salmonella enterica subsp. enterica serovar Vietnam]|nr:hypothetical protein [Salmonella enterica]HAE8197566.1 hypothetical protein [Salmonella enterica subsp. indica serovar 41:b:1,7]HAU3219480.1 hypothetical protein [Salmonella enterica subsp. indica]
MAIAKNIKQNGKTFEEFLIKYTRKLFLESAEFIHLSDSQQNQVYAEIVKAAGRPSPKINQMAKNYTRGVRVLIFISLAM